MSGKTQVERTPCPDCGRMVAIGDWPFCPHGPAGRGHHVSHTYYDKTLNQVVTPGGDRKKIMKAKNLEFTYPGVGMPGCEF